MLKKIFSVPFLLTTIIAGAAFLISLSLAGRDSLIMDELAHIPAGYGYVKYFDYRLNPEHPPLVKALSALPLAFMDLNFPEDKISWKEQVNSQWWAGTQFIFESGNNADSLIKWSRIGPIMILVLLIFMIYFWSAKLLGRWWAVVPTFLFAFSPNILAHGHYVTTDIGATFGIFAATFAFINFLEKPNRKNLIVAGLVFGMAQLLKFSAVLLVPFFIFLAFIHFLMNLQGFSRIAPNHKIKFLLRKTGQYLRWLFFIFLTGFMLIYAVYFVFTFNYPAEKQAGDAREILTSFAGGPAKAGEWCSPKRCLAEADIWMTKNAITKPIAEYLLGVLMVMQRSSGGNTMYFLGEVSGGGSTLYFPTVFLLKESLPALIFIAAAFVLAILRFSKGIIKGRIKLMEYLNTNFAEFSMLVFVVLYWVYSMKSPLNIGLRHIFPTIPFIYILAASSVKKSFSSVITATSNFGIANIFKVFEFVSKNIYKLGGIFVLLLWLSLETVFAYPNYLSYFNEMGGGTKNGYRMVTDSNYDWGQDLKELALFVEKNKIDKIAIDYFGGDNLAYRFQDKAVPWQSSKGNPKEEGTEWLAVSANTIMGAVAELKPGMEGTRKEEDAYLWLKAARNVPSNYTDAPEPDYRAGTSIFVYKLN